MCYRTDLFEKAGLPTDRDEVSALWPTWDDYIETGKKFKAGHRRRRRDFVDAATNMYNSILMQSGDGTPTSTHDDNRHRHQPGRQGRLGPRARCRRRVCPPSCSVLQRVERRLQEGTFATMACPAWMTGYITEQAGDGQAASGTSPRCPAAAATGAARSWRCRQSGKHQEADRAGQVPDQPDGQLAAFKAVGNLPSHPTLYEDPAVKAPRTSTSATRRPARSSPPARRTSSRTTWARRTSRCATRSRTRSAASRAGEKSSDDAWEAAVDGRQGRAG